MIKDNKIVVDLNKVQYARFFYCNQWGQHRDTLPKGNDWFTVRNEMHTKTEKAFARQDNPDELAYSMARRLHQLDIWIPSVRLQLQANHSLTYTGEKAKSIWKEWNRRVFQKKGK